MLYELWRGDNAALHEAAANALSRVAESLLQTGELEQAGRIYADLYAVDVPASLRLGALRGLALGRGEDAAPLLIELIAGEDQRTAGNAAQLLAEIPGEAVTQMLVAALDDAAPAAQVWLLDTLGVRGDMVARPKIVAAIESEDDAMRIAALRAMKFLGDETSVPVLARAAAESTGKVRNAARETLYTLPGEDVDQAILTGVGEQTDEEVRCELIQAVAERRNRAGVDALFTASEEPAEAVQLAAIEALGSLATEKHLPRLVQRLCAADNETVREAAENTVVATTLRSSDEQGRVTPVLAALDDTEGGAKAALIRVLGRVGGARALAAIRAERTAADEDVADAAVRALAAWPSAEVLDELRDIAGNSAVQTHRVLALRGFVRLVRGQGDLDTLEKYTLLQEALELAERADEKKLVLGGLAEVHHINALRTAKSLLADEALRDEAGVTMLTVARGLAAENPAVMRATIATVRAAATGENLANKVKEAEEFIERFRGYSATWLIAGPYVFEGKNSAALYEMVLVPEQPDAADIEWKPIKPNNHENPWIFDLQKTLGGDSRCVFARTQVWSETEQPARLEIGSDDCVKVWLNGEMVHANQSYRPVTPGEDMVDVTLKAGWNTLMLKVVQGGGGWGFCAGVKTPDGATILGLKFRAQ